MTVASTDRPAAWRRMAALVAIVLTAATFQVGVSAAPAEAAKKSPRQIILNQTNAYRVNHGKSKVKIHWGVTEVSQDWSEKMRKARTLKHNPYYSTQIPGEWVRVSENVGYACGYGGKRAAAKAIMRAWKNSPGHAENMRGAYGRIGIGFAYHKGLDCAWATQNFVKY
mgnify:CR=1 FL=1